MKVVSLVIASVFVLAAAGSARADLQPDVCMMMGAKEGAACTELGSGKPGTCVPDPNAPGMLYCKETASGSGGAGGSGGSGGDKGTAGSAGSTDDDDSGCSLSAGGSAGAAGGAVVAMIGAGALLLRRRRRQD